MHPAPPTLSLAEALAAARDTRCLDIGVHTLKNAPRMFREQFGDRHGVIVADRNTWAAAGDQVATAMAAAACPMERPFIFDAPVLPADMRVVEQLQHALQRHAAVPVVVGSGTLNDVTKLAAHRTQRPYMCVATAASMDGYTAFGASITHLGSKQTFLCPAPTAVLADLNVICQAPEEMNPAGYADLIAKVTAGADWLLADALGVEAIDAQAWSIVQARLRDMVADAAGVPARDPVAIGRLVEGLMLGGFAMQSVSSSRPASGAEHQFSHLWDMQHHQVHGSAPSHGFKVGVATLAVTALYESFLRLPIDQLDVERCCDNWPDQEAQESAVRSLFAGEDFVDKAVEETLAKYTDRAGLRAQLQRLRGDWPQLKRRLTAQLLPYRRLRAMLRAAGAPTSPREIGLTPERLRASFRMAYHIRRRFTILDAVIRTGMLERILDDVFGPTGPLSRAGQQQGSTATR